MLAAVCRAYPGYTIATLKELPGPELAALVRGMYPDRDDEDDD